MLLLALASCRNGPEHTAPAILERDSVAMMVSYGVNTLVSDSGVIKYRIVTERWEVNTVKQPQRWEFMKGVFFEQFDEQFHVKAYIQADSAWYYDQQKLWHLRGRVNIRNLNGLVYTSEELYWDGLHHQFYSNVFSRVVTPERTMEGTMFRSDERMDHYYISNSVGNFVKPDDDGGDGSSPAQQRGGNGSVKPATATPTDNDSLTAEPLRPAATKHQKQR